MNKPYNVKVTKVVDGDTLDILIDLSDEFLGVYYYVKHRVRLARINAPEINTDEGKCVKAYVESYLNPPVSTNIIVKGRDKYGRLVAEVFTIDHKNLSDILIEKGMVTLYSMELE